MYFNYWVARVDRLLFSIFFGKWPEIFRWALSTKAVPTVVDKISCIRCEMNWIFTSHENLFCSPLRLATILKKLRNFVSKNLQYLGGNLTPWAIAQPPVAGPPPKSADLLALHVAMSGPKNFWFGAPSLERHLFKIWTEVGQILTTFHKSTPTPGGYCEPPSGRILAPFAPKFLQYVLFSGDLGENPFLWPPSPQCSKCYREVALNIRG